MHAFRRALYLHLIFNSTSTSAPLRSRWVASVAASTSPAPGLRPPRPRPLRPSTPSSPVPSWRAGPLARPQGLPSSASPGRPHFSRRPTCPSQPTPARCWPRPPAALVAPSVSVGARRWAQAGVVVCTSTLRAKCTPIEAPCSTQTQPGTCARKIRWLGVAPDPRATRERPACGAEPASHWLAPPERPPALSQNCPHAPSPNHASGSALLLCPAPSLSVKANPQRKAQPARSFLFYSRPFSRLARLSRPFPLPFSLSLPRPLFSFRFPQRLPPPPPPRRHVDSTPSSPPPPPPSSSSPRTSLSTPHRPRTHPPNVQAAAPSLPELRSL